MKLLAFRMSNQRGAMLVQVAIAILTLTSFLVLVVDNGVLWLARGQLQNAADAGALAGAIARSFDERGHPVAANGIARTAAVKAAEANKDIWGNQDAVVGEPIFDWGGQRCPPGIAGKCARVDVFADAAHGNPIQTIFAGILGIANQSVRATATARTAIGTATNCLKPWAMVDKWVEKRDGNTVRDATWNPAQKYEQYWKQGNTLNLYSPPDQYTPPSTTSTGTGFTQQDVGVQLVLNPRSFSGNNTDIYGGSFVKLRLACPGADCYSEAISGCTGVTYSIGQVVEVDTQDGQMPQKTATGVEALLAKDPGASWTNGAISGSAYGTSPRIVPVALIDISTFPPNPTGAVYVPIVNLIGLFVEGTCGGLKNTNKLEPFSRTVCDSALGNQDVAYIVGRVMRMPALLPLDAPPIVEESSFMSVIQLVR